MPMQMESAKLHRGPRRRVCQFAHCPTQGLTNPKCNWLLNPGFFSTCDTILLKYHQKHPSKDNNDNCQN